MFSLGGIHAMRFGDPQDFAIEAYHEPASPEWAGFGRMCIHVQGARVGDEREEHCSLFHAVDRFRDLSRSIDGLWDTGFAGLSDAEIFGLLDDALYISSESRWDRFGKFDFLTNTGEQFDGFKTFIVCFPDRHVHILCQSRDDTFGFGVCRTATFRDVAESFVIWFDGQVGPPREPPNQTMERTADRSGS